ncbi:hypothetical protein MKW92_043077 [Papaver armeniacum]|nr:hypothetical protein MKW92_043077 [Papaver armeniacum]
MKHKELTDVKESFDGLTIELDNSRKKMQELEQNLLSSASDVQKFEELSNKSGSHAESETKRALEFEKLLELGKLSAKEMEDQMGSLQQELKDLYEKIAENQKVEEALRSTSAELSTVQGALEVSKSQALNLEHKLQSKEAVVDELSKDIVALENLFSQAKQDLQSKVAELEEVTLKLQEEVTTKKLVEERVKIEEERVSTVQEELARIITQKEDLEAAVVDLNGNVFQLKELSSDLESKLKVSDENFSKADTLLTQALISTEELEKKLKSVEDLHQESGVVAASATQKNVELEDILRASHAEVEEAKSQLREIETKLISSEQKNVELEQKKNQMELKLENAERELNLISEKIADTDAILRGAQEEKFQLESKIQDFEEKVAELKSSVDQSSLKNSELQKELSEFSVKCAEHEDRANSTQQRSVELEDLMQVSHSKAGDAIKRVGELEILLDAEKYRIQELEDQIKTLDTKCIEKEAESKTLMEKISELSEELEIFQTKSRSLELALQTANEKERELTECLNVIKEERKTLEDSSNSSSKKLSETENLLELLQDELKLAHEKLESVENDLKTSGIKECEIVDKLKSTETQLEEQSRVLEQTTTRNSELELLVESLTRNSELKLQEALKSLAERDSEAKTLCEKIKILEEQKKFFEDEAAETAERSASLKAELDDSSMKSIGLESTIEELRSKILEAEEKFDQSVSENELLTGTNLQLKNKVNELEELLHSAHAEKEATSQKLASHINTVAELTDQHSRSFELHSATESRAKEVETQLQEALGRITAKDSEVKELKEKLNDFDIRVRVHEEQANESSAVAESLKAQLEEALSKLKSMESSTGELQTRCAEFEKECEALAEKSFKQTQELAEYEGKMSDLHNKVSATVVEKNEAVEELNSLKTKIEDLTQELATQAEKLHSAHAEKEATSQKLASHISTVAELTDQHSRSFELHSATESRAKEFETQLQEALQRITEKDSEITELKEKLNEFDIRVRVHEEQAGESSAIAESLKVQLDEALLKFKSMESSTAELQTRCAEFEKECEGLAEKNFKQTQELAEYESKMNDVHTKLSATVVEKHEAVEELNSSKKKNEDLTQELVTQAEELQSQIASVMKENNMIHETYENTRKELGAVIAQMEGQLNEQKATEHALKLEVENLKIELSEMTVLLARVVELEQQLTSAENRLKEEVGNVHMAAAEKEAELTTKLEEHVHKLQDRDILHEKVMQLQEELHVAHSTIAEQKESHTKLEFERESSVKSTLEVLEDKHQQVGLLEKQIEELEQKLQLADTKSLEKDEAIKKHEGVYEELENLKKKSIQISELEKKIEELESKLKLAETISKDQSKEGSSIESKDGIEVKSRDLFDSSSTVSSSLSKRKSKKKSEATLSTTAAQTESASTHSKHEISPALTLQFIFGVAILSVFLGIFLGKRY